MRPTIVLASVLLPAVVIVGLPAVRAPQAPAPQTGSAPTPRPGATASPSPHPPVVFDLLTDPGPQPTEITIPRDRGFFSVFIANRAPGATYHVTHDWIVDPATNFRPRAEDLHGEVQLHKDIVANLGLGSRAPPEVCEPPILLAKELIASDMDERGSHAKLLALEDKKVGEGCPGVERLRKQVRDMAQLQLRTGHMLFDGDEVRYLVERVNPATGIALKTWRFVLRLETLRTGWSYANEEAWIVGETSRDIVEMMLYARDGLLPSAQRLGFSVAEEGAPGPFPRYAVAFSPVPGNPQRQSLGFASYIWAPESYEPLAAGLLASLRLRLADPSPPGLVSDALTNPLPGVLAQESQRVSRRLQTAMLDAGAHEQAALIVGALALREAAGPFTDVRQALCRMAAHLAVARALRRGTASPTAAYGDALLLTLVNRQKDALARIELLERAKPSPEWAAFLRGLRIRITRDWRILPEPAKATLFERLQHYEALRQSLDGAHAMDFLGSFKPEPIGDWGRLAFQSGVSVEQGHLFSPLLVGTEMHEAAEVYGILRGSPLTLDKVAEPLNAKPQRLVATESGPRPLPQVIGWGTWARFFQRNLVFAARASATFLNRMLSLEDEARELRGGLHESFSGLEIWPAESLTWLPRIGDPATDSPVRDAEGLRSDGCTRGLALTRDAPERVVPVFWSVLQSSCPGSATTLILQSKWLRTLAPAGTALMALYRGASLPPRTDPRPLYAAMHELAPFDSTFLREVPPPAQATSAQVKAFYGPLTDYDLVAMKRLAATQREDATAYRALYEKIAALVPREYLSLGDYLADLDRDDEAAAAYEKAVEKAPDRVGVSHHVKWLVGYYLDRSRVDRAREVAQMAADVYSGGGLETMAYFQERTGHYAEAEDWRQKNVQRYGNSAQAALDEFYIRYEHRIADGRFGGRSVAALAKVFPGGLERVSLAELTAPPPPGDDVRMEGDTVVAINGYRVHNDQQARVVWTFDDRPDWTMIAWRQGRYVEEKGRTNRLKYGPIARPS